MYGIVLQNDNQKFFLVMIPITFISKDNSHLCCALVPKGIKGNLVKDQNCTRNCKCS